MPHAIQAAPVLRHRPNRRLVRLHMAETPLLASFAIGFSSTPLAGVAKAAFRSAMACQPGQACVGPR